MKVELERTFPMPGSPEVAWAFLQNIEGVAACMPGAKITERLGDGRFKGTVSVKVGPASMSFRGEVEVRDIDSAQRSLRLLGKGTDSTGTSGASMDLAARITQGDGGLSNLLGRSDVAMSGKAAAFGGRMMSSVADQILKQFAANFAAQVEALSARAPAPPSAGGASHGAVDAPSLTPANVSGPSSAPPASGMLSAPSSPPAAPELDGLALAWAVFKDWLRGLFGKRTA